ncbi:unnamed protein product [Vitrella brassicaformis CCMP3155]|uniref:Uncharacterized protein n=2 Tax=Vitrella brassicaformis TaxID=1169539 RepID=A0A0G4FR24_VITBC|nr:unnamed protein product [Vitrella brassicaformis CCMP3155]|eukprot:CEM16676.1 unnamed protein product [Vitrella brassicaformis CCMP3155]
MPQQQQSAFPHDWTRSIDKIPEVVEEGFKMHGDEGFLSIAAATYATLFPSLSDESARIYKHPFPFFGFEPIGSAQRDHTSRANVSLPGMKGYQHIERPHTHNEHIACYCLAGGYTHPIYTAKRGDVTIGADLLVPANAPQGVAGSIQRSRLFSKHHHKLMGDAMLSAVMEWQYGRGGFPLYYLDKDVIHKPCNYDPELISVLVQGKSDSTRATDQFDPDKKWLELERREATPEEKKQARDRLREAETNSKTDLELIGGDWRVRLELPPEEAAEYVIELWGKYLERFPMKSLASDGIVQVWCPPGRETSINVPTKL